MVYFDIASKRYKLRHNNGDDSRSVIACEDMSFTELVRIDSSLVVSQADRVVGRMTVNFDTDTWAFVPLDGPVKDLQVPCQDYSWSKLVVAEIEAVKLLLI